MSVSVRELAGDDIGVVSEMEELVGFELGFLAASMVPNFTDKCCHPRKASRTMSKMSITVCVSMFPPA